MSYTQLNFFWASRFLFGLVTSESYSLTQVVKWNLILNNTDSEFHGGGHNDFLILRPMYTTSEG